MPRIGYSSVGLTIRLPSQRVLGMNYIRVKNWDEYQHYKDRSAPWIKLHKELLSSHFWVMGSDASKLLAICLMLLAQRNDNKIPADSVYIKRFGHLEVEPDFMPLIDAQLIEFIDENECLQDASMILSTCTPEKNRGEKNRGEKNRGEKIVFVLPDWIDKKMWDLWMKTRKGKKMIPEQMQAHVDQLNEWKLAGLDHHQALSKAATAGWQGLFEPKTETNRRSIHDERANIIAELTGKNRESESIDGTAVRVD